MTDEAVPTDKPTGIRATDVVTPEQLIALGKVAAEWGMLEVALNSHASVLTKMRAGWARITGNPGGGPTAQLLSEVLPLYLPEHPDTAQRLIAVLRSIIALANRRHDVVHAAWGNIIDAKSPFKDADRGFLGSEPNWGYLMKQKGRTLKQFPIGANDLEKLASEIGDARLQINALVEALPEPYGAGEEWWRS